MLTELSAQVPNEAGKLQEILEALNIVNIQAFSIEDAGYINIIRLICSDPNAAKYQLLSREIPFEENEVIAVSLDHKPGQLLRVATHLGQNDINIEHGFLTLDLTSGKAIVLVKTNSEDIDKAHKILRESNFELCDEIVESLTALAAPLLGELDIHPKGKTEKLRKIIDAGENTYAEFKTTMRYDMNTRQVNKELAKDICATICAFMNTRGGTLLIGVDDDGTPKGLKNDFKTLGKKQNRDGFLLEFSNIIAGGEIFDAGCTVYIEPYFLTIDDQDIFVVEVSKSESAVWINKDTDFYIRVTAGDRKLVGRRAQTYIDARFNAH